MANLDLKTRTLPPGNLTTRYPSAGLAQAETDFRRRYPEYEHTTKLDELRATDYARLDRQEHVYLDYTGGGLYAESQLRDHIALLNEQVYGNPHSKNLTSMCEPQQVKSHPAEQNRIPWPAPSRTASTPATSSVQS